MTTFFPHQALMRVSVFALFAFALIRPAYGSSVTCASTASSVGCYNNDIEFSNFQSVNGAGSTAPLTSAILLPAGTGGVVSANSIAPIFQSFNYQGANFNNGDKWVLNFQVSTANQYGVTPPPAPSAEWYVTQFRVSSGTLGGGVGQNTINISLALCSGLGVGCGAAVVSNTAATVGPSPFLTVAPDTEVFYVQATVNFLSKNGNPNFDQFTLEFQQSDGVGVVTPEPSAFLLLGAGLTFLGAVRRRRR